MARSVSVKLSRSMGEESWKLLGTQGYSQSRSTPSYPCFVTSSAQLSAKTWRRCGSAQTVVKALFSPLLFTRDSRIRISGFQPRISSR